MEAVSASGVEDDNDDEMDGEGNESEVELLNSDVWIEVRSQQYLSIEEVLDTTLELITSCLCEPISLGLFPFQT